MPENKQDPIFCGQHLELVVHLAEIKTSVNNIEKGMASAATYKTGVYTSIISMAILLVVQIIAFSFLYGKLVNQVEVNTSRLGIIERNLIK